MYKEKKQLGASAGKSSIYLILFLLWITTISLTSCAQNKYDKNIFNTENPLFVFSDITEDHINFDGTYQLIYGETWSVASYQEIMDYIPYFDEYNSKYFKNKLNENEQALYNAIVFMLEENIPFLSFPSDVNNEKVYEIMEMAIFDYPSLETQMNTIIIDDTPLGKINMGLNNSDSDYLMFDLEELHRRLGFEPNISNKYLTIHVNYNEPYDDKEEKYDAILSEASNIISQMNEENLKNEYEKGEWIYQYLVSIRVV